MGTRSGGTPPSLHKRKHSSFALSATRPGWNRRHQNAIPGFTRSEASTFAFTIVGARYYVCRYLPFHYILLSLTKLLPWSAIVRVIILLCNLWVHLVELWCGVGNGKRHAVRCPPTGREHRDCCSLRDGSAPSCRGRPHFGGGGRRRGDKDSLCEHSVTGHAGCERGDQTEVKMNEDLR